MAQITSIERLREIIPAPSEKAFAKIRDRLCRQARAFVERSPFVMFATIGDWGVEVSQKGGDAGFIEIVDDRTLLIPEYRGNQFALCLGNILKHPRAAWRFCGPGPKRSCACRDMPH